jgi:protein involved in temperature-dependent protein secretion
VQLQLADYMHQLGMHELGEAMLARARRRAGGRTSSLLSLMQHYQSQGDEETAIEIAFQILRRARPRGSAAYSRNSGADEAARTQAVQVLSQSGQLEDLIARAKEQLERSPNSLALRQTLVEYYRASGEEDLMIEELKAIAELRPDDARHQYGIAQQLMQAGKQAAACDFYLAALREMPSILNNDFYEIQRAFQQAERLDDLLSLFDEIDLKQIGQYYYVTNLVEVLVNDEKTRDQGVALFKRLWNAFPDQRSYILGNINREEIWKLPEMYDYAREAVIPESDQTAGFPWAGVQDYNILRRLMDAAQSQNKLDALFEEVTAKREELPAWGGGMALLAIIDARRNRMEAAQQQLSAMMDELQEAIPLMARYQMAQLLMPYDALHELLVRLYEEGMHEYQQQSWGWGSGPKHDLARLYVSVGRKSDARDILVKSWSESDFSQYYGYNVGYAAYRKINYGQQVAQQLVESGFPVDALRICHDVTGDPQLLQQARQYRGDSMRQEIDRVEQQAAQAVTPETLLEALTLWVPPTSTETATDDTGSDDGHDDSELDDDRAQRPAFDLMLSVQPPTMKEARVTSVFETAVAAAATDAAVVEQIGEQLDQIDADQQTQLGLDVTGALLAFAASDSSPQQLESVERVAGYLRDHPLEELKEGERPNARQRREAAEQLAVWLVARKALAQDDTRELGRFLADRAAEAARRQTDDIWLLAILREQGEAALEADDPQQAEQHFTEMLDLILPLEEPDEEQPSGKDRLSRRPSAATGRGGGF